MINKKFILILGIILNCTTALPALSQCTISVTPVKFSSYDPSTANPSTGKIDYVCTSVTAITIGLSKGNASSYTPRQLKNGANSLNYNLYLDAAGTQIWGDGIGGITNQYTNSNATTGTVDIFGKIPSGQNGSVGNYTDPITATINY